MLPFVSSIHSEHAIVHSLHIVPVWTEVSPFVAAQLSCRLRIRQRFREEDKFGVLSPLVVACSPVGDK